jgi:hypothetical protein
LEGGEGKRAGFNGGEGVKVGRGIKRANTRFGPTGEKMVRQDAPYKSCGGIDDYRRMNETVDFGRSAVLGFIGTNQ